MPKEKTLRENTRRTTLASAISDPYKWYGETSLREAGLSKRAWEEMAYNENALIMVDLSQKERLLGGYVLAYGIRNESIPSKVISGLESRIRFLDPLKLAGALELLPTELPQTVQTENGQEPFIQLVTIDQATSEYFVPVERLAYMRLPALRARKMSDLSEGEVIRIYRITQDPSYFNFILNSLSKVIDGSLSKHQEARKILGEETLIRAAQEGAKNAVEGFDLTRGLRLATYASRRINSAILDFLRDIDYVPRTVRSAAKSIREMAERLDMDLDKLEPKEVARLIKRSLSTVEGAFVLLRNKGRMVSMHYDESNGSDRRGGREEISHIGRVVNLKDPRFKQIDDEEIIDLATEGFEPEERAIVLGYHVRGMPMKQVAEEHVLSESRISQLMPNLLLRMRANLERRGMTWAEISS